MLTELSEFRSRIHYSKTSNPFIFFITLRKRARRHALEALEDGGVLRVRGRHLRVVFPQQRQDNRPAGDERLLVREGDGAAELDRFDRRQEPRAADDARHDLRGATLRAGSQLLGILPRLLRVAMERD